MSFPRTTHQWLRHVYAALNGFIPLRLGSPTGVINLYGASNMAPQIATGTAIATGWTGAAGASSVAFWANGGTGSYYNFPDTVLAMKNAGILKP